MREPVVRHFLVCRRAEYDWGEPSAPYILRNVMFVYRPPGETYPTVKDDLWLFARLEGEGDHELWIEVVQVAEPDEPPDDTTDTLTAAYGPHLVRLGPTRASLSRGWHVRGVPFPQPGWHEFRLTAADIILAREPIYLED